MDVRDVAVVLRLVGGGEGVVGVDDGGESLARHLVDEGLLHTDDHAWVHGCEAAKEPHEDS